MGLYGYVNSMDKYLSLAPLILKEAMSNADNLKQSTIRVLIIPVSRYSISSAICLLLLNSIISVQTCNI